MRQSGGQTTDDFSGRGESAQIARLIRPFKDDDSTLNNHRQRLLLSRGQMQIWGQIGIYAVVSQWFSPPHPHHHPRLRTSHHQDPVQAGTELGGGGSGRSWVDLLEADGGRGNLAQLSAFTGLLDTHGHTHTRGRRLSFNSDLFCAF